jgi:hypothetical protein
MTNFFGTIVLFVLVFSVSAKAERTNKCMGEQKLHSIVFASEGSTEGNLTIRRSIDGETKEELLDDTGYLSAMMLTSYLLSTGESQVNVDSDKRSDSLLLLRRRLLKFKNLLIQAGTSSGSPVLAAIGKIEQTLINKPIEKEALRKNWLALESAIKKDSGLHIWVNSRKPGTSKWGSNEELEEFTLPDMQTIRGISCIDEVGDLQLGDALEASTYQAGSNDGGRQNELNLENAKKKKATR